MVCFIFFCFFFIARHLVVLVVFIEVMMVSLIVSLVILGYLNKIEMFILVLRIVGCEAAFSLSVLVKVLFSNRLFNGKMVDLFNS